MRERRNQTRGEAALRWAWLVAVATFGLPAAHPAEAEGAGEVGKTPTPAPLAEPLAATFNPVPSFERLKTDIDLVGTGLDPLLRLDEELQGLAQELMGEVKKLAGNQNDPRAASEANRLITRIQARLLETIGDVLENRDLIHLGIDSANRKLRGLEVYLEKVEGRFAGGAEGLGEEIEEAKAEALDVVNDYIAFVDGLIEPVSREDRVRALELEGKVQQEKFRLDLLRLDRRRQKAIAKGYANMKAALGRWIDDFHLLKSKTRVMVNQLEAEHDFLARGIQMNVDAARVRHFMENPLALPDGTSIQAVNERIGRIFSMIEIFTGIQGRVQDALFGFNVVAVEEGVTEKVDRLRGMKDRALDLKRQIMSE